MKSILLQIKVHAISTGIRKKGSLSFLDKAY